MDKRQFLIFLFLLITFSYFIQGGGFNQNSTIAEIREVVEHGKLDISNWTSITGDVSKYNGKTFTNKSPNMLFFVAPVYFLFFHSAALLGFTTQGLHYDFVATHLITILCSGFWGALSGMYIFKILALRAKFLKVYQKVFLSLASCLATLVFPYSTVAFVHSFETFWCVYAIYRLLLLENRQTASNIFALALAFGMMILSNPVLAPAAGIGCVLALSIRRKFDSILILGIGCLLPLLPLFLYNYNNFDFFLATNRHFQNESFTDKSKLMGVFQLPQFSVIWDIFYYSNRSLIPSMTWLYFSISGIYFMKREKMFRTTTHIFTGSIFLLYILFMMTFNNPHGGTCYGPRYMVPALVIMALYTAPAIKYLPRIFWLVVLPCYAIQMVVTSANMFVDFRQADPLEMEIIPLFKLAQFKVNNYPSFLSTGATYYKYTLGNVLGMEGFTILFFLLGIQISILYLLLRSSGKRVFS